MPTTSKGQILASTAVDGHGEQRDRSFLDDLVAAMPSRMPLNQHHDQSRPTVGSIENFRVESDGEGWVLKGDVTFDGPPPSSGGFSFSTTEIVHHVENPTLALFLPWPHYRNDELLKELAGTVPGVTSGKWLKKSLEPGEVALIISGLTFFLGPMWRQVYDSKVHPALCKVAGATTARLRQLGAGRARTDFVQNVKCDHYDNQVQLYFVPDESVDLQLAYGVVLPDAISASECLLKEDWEAYGKPVKRVVYIFDAKAVEYKPTSVVYIDGTTRSP